MQANVVVNRIPYVTAPSPYSRTILFFSVTSWRKLEKEKCLKFPISHYAVEYVEETPPVFIVGKKSIRYPNLFGEIARKRENLVIRAERETVIFPVLVEIHGDCVVL